MTGGEREGASRLEDAAAIEGGVVLRTVAGVGEREVALAEGEVALTDDAASGVTTGGHREPTGPRDGQGTLAVEAGAGGAAVLIEGGVGETVVGAFCQQDGARGIGPLAADEGAVGAGEADTAEGHLPVVVGAEGERGVSHFADELIGDRL